MSDVPVVSLPVTLFRLSRIAVVDWTRPREPISCVEVPPVFTVMTSRLMTTSQ